MDLKLNNKWWHRLIVVVWSISIFFVVLLCYFYVKEGYENALYGNKYSCKRVYVGDLTNRMNDNVQDVYDLVAEREYIDIDKRNEFDLEGLYKPSRGVMWCSSKWDKENIETLEILARTKFFKSGGIEYNSIDEYEEIANRLTTDPCVRKDTDGMFRYNQGYNYYIFTMPCPEKSKVTMEWLLLRLGWSILFILLYISVSMLFYYRAVLYIIYGSSKN